jgi:hypothetical protein
VGRLASPRRRGPDCAGLKHSRSIGHPFTGIAPRILVDEQSSASFLSFNLTGIICKGRAVTGVPVTARDLRSTLHSNLMDPVVVADSTLH